MTTTSDGLGWDWQKLTVEAKKVYPPVCHLCLLPIDVRLPKTHAKSYTLDHLDARAKYGKQVPHISRVRPAHRDCNARRGMGDVKASPRSREW